MVICVVIAVISAASGILNASFNAKDIGKLENEKQSLSTELNRKSEDISKLDLKINEQDRQIKSQQAQIAELKEKQPTTVSQIAAQDKRWSSVKQEAAQQKCTDAFDETSSKPPFYACVGGVHAYGNIRTLIKEWSTEKAKLECKKVCKGASTNQVQCDQGCDYAFSEN